MTVDLEAAKRLCEQATPGPWRWSDWSARFGDVEDGERMLTLTGNDDRPVEPQVAKRTGSGRHVLTLEERIDHEADAAFIAASRQLVPALIAEVRRLSDDLERWRNAGICPNCGRGKFDEDGCCSTCGRDVIGFVDGKVVRPLPDAPDTGRRLSDVDAMAGRLKAIVGPLWSEAYCVEVAKGLVGRG